MSRITADRIRNNWYQRDSYFASSFALVSTKNQDGSFNLRPYQLTLPFRVDGEPQIQLIMRAGSRTSLNIERTGQCLLNYVEYSPELVALSSVLGNPFLSHEARDSAIDLDFGIDGALADAFQTIRCSLTDMTVTSRAAYAILKIDRIDSDGREPVMAITHGCHGDEFLFSKAPITDRIKIEVPNA